MRSLGPEADHPLGAATRAKEIPRPAYCRPGDLLFFHQFVETDAQGHGDLIQGLHREIVPRLFRLDLPDIVVGEVHHLRQLGGGQPLFLPVFPDVAAYSIVDVFIKDKMF